MVRQPARPKIPALHCLHRTGKLGLGTAIIAAMKYALANGYGYVLTMDADFSHPPKCLPAMVAGMNPANGPSVDVMIGSRYIPGGGVEGWPLEAALHEPRRELLCPLVPRAEAQGLQRQLSLLPDGDPRQLDFDQIRSRGYSLQEEILWRLKRVGARFGETPIVFVERQRGKSKIDLKEAVNALRIIFSLGMQSLFGALKGVAELRSAREALTPTVHKEACRNACKRAYFSLTGMRAPRGLQCRFHSPRIYARHSCSNCASGMPINCSNLLVWESRALPD